MTMKIRFNYKHPVCAFDGYKLGNGDWINNSAANAPKLISLNVIIN